MQCFDKGDHCVSTVQLHNGAVIIPVAMYYYYQLTKLNN